MNNLSKSLFSLVFQDKPPTPPSAAQEAAQRLEGMEAEQVSFIQSLKNLMTNRNFIFLLLSYGINVGVFYAISTLLNPVQCASSTLAEPEAKLTNESLSLSLQVVLKYYPGHEVDTGRIGLSIVLAGMLGSVVSGIVLDKTHKFK